MEMKALMNYSFTVLQQPYLLFIMISTALNLKTETK